jgi:hypothetical protein
MPHALVYESEEMIDVCSCGFSTVSGYQRNPTCPHHGDARQPLRYVHCTYCNKTHSAKATDTPCSPNAWIDL